MSQFTATVTAPNHGETMWAVDVYKNGKPFYTVYYTTQEQAESYAASFNKDG